VGALKFFRRELKLRRYKIKGRWEYIVKPERVIFIKESKRFIVKDGEFRNNSECKVYNKFWYYFHGKQPAMIRAMTTAPDGSIWVAGEKGLIAYWNGNEWINGGQWCHGEANIKGLTVALDGSIWAIGSIGIWEENLFGVWVEKKKGDSGSCKIARWDGSKWEDKSQGCNVKYCNFILTTPGGDILVGNDKGYAACWDGNIWVDVGRWFISSGWWVNCGITDLDGNIWLAGIDGMTARWDGEKWEVFNSWPQHMDSYEINALTVTPDGILWAGGDNGLLAYWDGSKWVACEQWFCRSHESKMVQEVQYLVESYVYNSSESEDPCDICDDISALTVAPDGSIWAATYTNDIARWVYEVEE